MPTRDASPAASVASSSHSSEGRSRDAPNTDSSGWDSYATSLTNSEGALQWKCNWDISLDQSGVLCSYVAKKQLVKRHIETTHMKLK